MKEPGNSQAKNKSKYDLAERTVKFGEKIIELAKRISTNTITLTLISQLVKSGTSIGANYSEANCAETRKDFEHKIGICKKEAGETQYWLRMIIKAMPELNSDSTVLLQEARELQLIFITIVKNSRLNGERLLD